MSILTGANIVAMPIGEIVVIFFKVKMSIDMMVIMGVLIGIVTILKCEAFNEGIVFFDTTSLREHQDVFDL